jgi:hypothetical protein
MKTQTKSLKDTDKKLLNKLRKKRYLLLIGWQPQVVDKLGEIRLSKFSKMKS